MSSCPVVVQYKTHTGGLLHLPFTPFPQQMAKRLGLGKPFIHFSPNLFRASTSICSFQCMVIYHVSSYMSIESWDFSPEKNVLFLLLGIPNSVGFTTFVAGVAGSLPPQVVSIRWLHRSILHKKTTT